MLFMVEMDVLIPHDMAPDVVDDLKAREKARAQALQEAGTWRHIWRVAGRYANVSIFDVEDADALHDIMLSLPLFPFMNVNVTALCRHPSSIHEHDD